MDINLQKKKINQKIDLITKLIESLSKYNSIEGYTNQKKFTIEISYRRETNDPNYYYNINILRGTNQPKNIFNMRFVSPENIDLILNNLIESFTTNESFSHTSFSSNFNSFSSYDINLKTNIEIKFSIKNQEDYDRYNEIEKRFAKKEIRMIPPERSNKSKDELQEEKMINTIDLMQNILNTLEEYNSIESYDNKKPFRFNVKNYYDKFKECYVYTFLIMRGDTKPEIFLTLNASLQNKNIYYNRIYDLLSNFKQKESFLIDMTSNNYYKGTYTMLTKNNISLEFVFEDEIDKNFFANFMNETNAKRTEFDLSQTKNKLLNPNE